MLLKKKKKRREKYWRTQTPCKKNCPYPPTPSVTVCSWRSEGGWWHVFGLVWAAPCSLLPFHFLAVVVCLFHISHNLTKHRHSFFYYNYSLRVGRSHLSMHLFFNTCVIYIVRFRTIIAENFINNNCLKDLKIVV